jgi:hypothetical protein
MAGQVWPAPQLEKKSREVVFLAVYRYGVVPPGARAEGLSPVSAQGGRPKASPTDPSDWAIRLDVQGYPQFRLLDHWGRPLEDSDRHAGARSVDQVLAAADAAKAGARGGSAPPDVRLPVAVLEKVPKDRRETAASPDPDARVKLWREVLGDAKWDPRILAALVQGDPDPVVRMEALARFPAAAPPAECVAALRLGVDGSNDYVRARCLDLLGGAGPDGAAIIRETVEKALAGGADWHNPNNVLCGALSAAEKTADPSLVEVLGKVVRKVGTNNSALVIATRALAATGKAHGMAPVREHLLAAKAREDGPVMAEVRRIADNALGK